MEHYITAITSHAAGQDKATVHWVMASCRCGVFFSVSVTSTDWKGAAQHLSREATRHVTQWNQHDLLNEPLDTTMIVPRVES